MSLKRFFLWMIPLLLLGSLVAPSQSADIHHVFLPLVMIRETAYYVSPLGNDTNPGTYDLPWRTISHAADSIDPGSLVYIRGGEYHELVNIYASGTQQFPLRFIAYPGEVPIIDGEYQLPYSGAGLVNLHGDWIIISGIEVKHSSYYGIGVYGQHNTVRDVNVHHNYKIGVILNGDYGLLQDSWIWRNSITNEYGVSTSWSSGVVAGRDLTDGITSYAVVRGNRVWENWGQGISTYEADHTTIEQNFVSDSYTANIYIHDATNILCQQNLIYTDPSSYVYAYGAHRGILMGDERDIASTHIFLINNLLFGNNWNYALNSGTTIINDVLVANNTFVNGIISGGVLLRGYHQNIRFQNNIVLQDDALPGIVIALEPDVTFSHNLWSKIPPSIASDPGDIISDPQLAEIGSPFLPDWFRLLATSPAIGHALSLPEILVDYFGNWRDSAPDMGAVEHFP